MTRRDPIVALVHDFLEEPAVDDVAILDDARRLADRILALIFPETPDPEMVEAMASVYEGRYYYDPQNLEAHEKRNGRDAIRAALAAERKWWSE